MVEKSWEQLFPGLTDPVSGSPGSYDTAETEARALHEATQACSDEFARVSGSGSLSEMGGQAADQLITVIKEIDGSFHDVPPVFSTLTSIFDDHGRRLREIRTAAATALAKANTRWDDLDTARADKSTADVALAGIKSQIWNLQTYGDAADPTTQQELDELGRQQSQHGNAVTTAQGRLTTAEDDFNLSRTDHENIRQQERDLIDDSVDRIKQIDLEDLKDPNRVLGFLSDVAEWGANLITDLVMGVVEIVEALAKGDFLDALHHLSDWIDAALMVLAVVGLALAIFASGGALAPLVLGLVIAKLATDTVLATTQHPHPDTGQPKTWGDVAVDLAVVGLTVATGGIANSGTIGSRMSGMSGAARRSLLGNASNLRTPLSAAGNPLYGAARASTIVRSQKELTTFAIDQTVGELGNRGLGLIDTSSSTMSNPDVFTNPTLVDFARNSPMTSGGRSLIQTQSGAIGNFTVMGPSSRPTAPPFHVTSTMSPVTQ